MLYRGALLAGRIAGVGSTAHGAVHVAHLRVRNPGSEGTVGIRHLFGTQESTPIAAFAETQGDCEPVGSAFCRLPG